MSYWGCHDPEFDEQADEAEREAERIHDQETARFYLKSMRDRLHPPPETP